MQNNSSFLNYFLILLIKIGILFSFPLYAQEGHFILFDHNPKLQNIDNHNISIIQGSNGVMYFANKKGILSYDGVKWKLIRTPGSVYALHSGSGRIYAGCKENFGYLKKDPYGKDVYVSISDSLPTRTQGEKFGEITSIEIINDQIYFYANRVLVCYSIKNNVIENSWQSSGNGLFTGLVITNKDIFINISGQGLNRVDRSGLSPIPGGEIFSNTEIITSFHYKNDTVLIGTSENEIFLFEGKQFIPYSFEAKDYLLESVLSGGIELSTDHFVFSTLTGGCIFIDKKNGVTLATLNYQTGLPDDEIFAMGKDKNGGLWITHDYGITRVDNTLPVKNYSSYPGLEGNLISVIEFDSTIYVATSEGIFYLTEVKDIKELMVYIKKPVQKEEDIIQTTEIIYVKTKIEKQIPRDTNTINQYPELSKKIQRLKRKLEKQLKKEGKTDAEKLELEDLRKLIKTLESTKDKSPQTEIKPVRRVINRPVKKEYEIKKVYALQSVKHVYKQVNGFKGKCKQLVKLNDRILAASNTGLYEILKPRMNSDKPEAKPIIKDLYVNCIYQSKDTNRFYVGLATGIKSVRFTGKKWQVEDTIFQDILQSVYSIIEDDEQNLWLGCENNIYRIIIDTAGQPVDYYAYFLGDAFSEIILVRKIFGKIFFITASETYCYISPQSPYKPKSPLLWGSKQHVALSVGDIFATEELNSFFSENLKLIYSQDHITWGYNGAEWAGLPALKLPRMGYPEDGTDKQHGSDKFSEKIILKEIYFALFNNIKQIYVDREKNIWLINSDGSLFKINKEDREQSNKYFEVFINGINDGEGNPLLLNGLELDYRNSAVILSFAAPFYINETSTQYQYIVEGVMKDWSEWNRNASIPFPFLSDGKYTIRVRAKNVLGKVSEEKTFSFRVMPPFWNTLWFYLLCFISVTGLVFVFIRIRERNLRRQQKILEEKVQIRTVQLKEKNEEIEKKNQAITASINYAKRIQESILPLKENILKVLPYSFILYKPKDIVSGDFYWWSSKNGRTLIAAVDCTGHGVPGAFMSMIGNTLLNDIVNVKNIISPAPILDELHTDIKTLLHQDEKDALSPDGMDISLCSIDMEKHEIQFAGAIHHLCIVRNVARIDNPTKPFIEDIESDPFSIGGMEIKAGKTNFTNHTFQMQKNETMYLFSDGFEDQFGGEDNKKFSSERFKKLLLDIHQLEMTKQEEVLNQTFEEWKGNAKQVDDVVVIGIRF
ncbi:MAG: SpoIIE family protein phosphatase [Cytophagales bacterium]|nr:SpoIIE family protein phosphatase [Cytophagales bacterium]